MIRRGFSRRRLCQCSKGFNLVNFHETSYFNSQNKEMPMYDCDEGRHVFMGVSLDVTSSLIGQGFDAEHLGDCHCFVNHCYD